MNASPPNSPSSDRFGLGLPIFLTAAASCVLWFSRDGDPERAEVPGTVERQSLETVSAGPPGQEADPVSLRPHSEPNAGESEPGGRAAISPEQQEAAFQHFQRIQAGEMDREGARRGEPARFESIEAGGFPPYVEEAFAIQTDRFGNVIGHNPAMRFEADFSEWATGGVKVRSWVQPAELGLRMRAFGAGPESMTPAGAFGEASVEGARVSIDRGGGVTEWFVNGETGLEQGWTIASPPSGVAESGELRISLELNAGELEAEQRSGDRIVFRDQEGRAVFRYGKLVVTDAAGTVLPAWMQSKAARENGESGRGHEVILVAQTRGAKFPVTVDPLVSFELASFQGQIFGGSYPRDLVEVGGVMFFQTGDGIWKSDGTRSGTLFVSSKGSNPSNLTVVGDTVFFRADDENSGSELWKTDGTDAGTVLVKDIWTGFFSGSNPNSSSPTELTNVDGTLFFIANDGVHGTELWASDGTEAGTMMVKDTRPGSADTYPTPEHLTSAGGLLFFRVNDGTGWELWKSDGTTGGTGLVKDIEPGFGTFGPQELTEMGGNLFFTADDGTHGIELWKSDGTSSGTVMVEDIRSGSPNSSPRLITDVNGTLFFEAFDGVNGSELWKSNGTAAGTVMVKDIQPGGFSASIFGLAAVGDTAFFVADDGVHGRELWKSDGSAAGTIMMGEIVPGTNNPFVERINPVGNRAYFVADDGTSGEELWTSDGTPTGTVQVRDIWPGSNDSSPDHMAALNGKLMFSAADESSDNELWISDGTEAGTTIVRDIGGARNSLTQGRGYAELGNEWFFSTHDGVHGIELWKTDGTVAGTMLVKDIYPGAISSTPKCFTVFGSSLYFCASDGVNGTELWKSDGTSAGTVMVVDINPSGSSSPGGLAVVGSNLFFSANDGSTGSELWKSDGTAGGTMRVKDIRTGVNGSSIAQMTAVGSTVFFAANDGVTGVELWKSDGTEAGTVQVKDVRDGFPTSYLENLTAVGGLLFFSADNAIDGKELWKSDGTEAGTMMVKDIASGSGGSSPNGLRNWGGLLFFDAYDGTCGRELWKSDGSPAGTVLVKDIYPGPPGSLSLDGAVESGGNLFFRATDGTHGRELWKTDGTGPGTVLVKDVWPGSEDSDIFDLSVAGGLVYFRAVDGVHGEEVWVSDGTGPGTVIFDSILPGELSSDIYDLTTLGDQVIFSAVNGDPGRSLRVLRSAPDIFINEVDGLTGNGQGREFVELYDGGGGNTSLDGLVLVFFDGATDASYRAIGLNGRSTDGGGFFVVGSAGTPQVDLVIPSGTLQDGADAVALYLGTPPDFPNGTGLTTDGLIDAVVYDSGQADDLALLGLLGRDEPQIDESKNGFPLVQSLQRLPNGSGNFRATSTFAVMSPTPGVLNSLPGAPAGLDLADESDTGESNADNLTNDTTPTITGTARAGSLVTLTSDLDGVIGVGGTDSSGNWSITIEPGSALQEGAHDLSATADGGAASAALAIQIETTPPAIPAGLDLTAPSDTGISSEDNSTSDNTPEITGQSDAGTTVTLFADGNPVGTGSANSPWTIEASALADGLRQMTATASDAAGNESAPSVALAVTIDTQAPAVAVSPAGGQADPAGGAPVEFEVVFSEAVVSFDSGDLTLGGSAGPSNLQVGGGPSNFTATVGGVTGEGTVTLAVGAGVTTDASGNGNTASTSGDGTVMIDIHGNTAGTATVIPVGGGNGAASGWIDAGDSDFFSFTLTEPKLIQIETTGSVDTLGRLRDGSAELINVPNSDDNRGAENNFRINKALPAGNYTVEIIGKGASSSGAYQIEITLGILAELQPDARVGKTAGVTSGDGVYGTAAGQTQTLASRKARTVRGVVGIENDGEIPDNFAVAGSRGNALFKVTYRSAAENHTAAIMSGTYQTGEMAPGDPSHLINVTVKPNKRKIVKKIRRGRRTKFRTKRKRITLALRGLSETNRDAVDAVFFKVKTK